MKFDQAIKLIAENNHLLGKKEAHGFIDELIICPTDPELFEKFKENYRLTLDWKKSISPYLNEDVNILCVINKREIRVRNLFYFKTLQEIHQNSRVNKNEES